MTPDERDVARQRAANHLESHDGDCAPGCGPCIAARAILAFVPSGDACLPPWFSFGIRCEETLLVAIGDHENTVISLGDAATMRALGLALIAQADAIASQGEGGKGGR